MKDTVPRSTGLRPTHSSLVAPQADATPPPSAGGVQRLRRKDRGVLKGENFKGI